MKARLLWFLGIGCLFLPVFDDPPLRTGAYVQRVVGDGAVVAIITAEPEPLTLEVRGGEGEMRSLSSPEGRRHEFEIQGLVPDRHYEFAVVDREGREVDRGSFRSAPVADDAEVRFAVVADSGETPWWMELRRSALLQLPERWGWLPVQGDVGRIADGMAEAAPDFWLHAGDLAYARGELEVWSVGFFRPFAELLRRSPVYPVMGNHDLEEDGGRPLLDHFVLPGEPGTGDERFFSFAYGGVRVIGVDLNGVLEAEARVLEYLRGQLAGSSEPWVVVLSHFPVRSVSRHRHEVKAMKLEEHLLPLLEEYLVDLYFAGHDHVYSRFSGEVALVTTGGGGGSLYSLVEDPLLVASAVEHHFCVVEVSGAMLTMRAVDGRNEVMDELVLDLRELPERVAALRERNPARHARITALLR